MAEVLLAGLQDDLDEIVYKFSSLKSFDFNKFTSVWNELKFYNIFCGRPTELEMRFFTQHVLMFTKNKAINKGADEWERVSGLYLLYCLYYSQPLLKHVEIRINHDDLKELEQFVKSIHASYAPVYAFTKLTTDNAFHFVYNDVPNTIERSGKVDMNLLGKLGDEGEIKEQRQAVMELIKKAKVDEKEWRLLETDYNNTLGAISQMNIGPNKVNFSKMDFFKEMLFPEKTPQPADAVENSQDPKPGVIPKRRKQRLLKMMVEGLLTKDEEVDEGAHPDGESLPLLDCPMDT